MKLISRRRHEKMQAKIRKQCDEIRDLTNANDACGSMNEALMAEIREAEQKNEELSKENRRLREACRGMEQQRDKALSRAAAAEQENRMLMCAMDAISAAGNRELLGVGLEALVKEGLA